MEVECSTSTDTHAHGGKGKSIFLGTLACWLLLSTSTITVLTWPNPRVRATVGMGWGLILLWIGFCGTLMYRFREPIKAAVQRIRWGWRMKFIVMATVLALTEEAITTTMTNLAPLFGVKVGQAYIRASTKPGRGVPAQCGHVRPAVCRLGRHPVSL